MDSYTGFSDKLVSLIMRLGFNDDFKMYSDDDWISLMDAIGDLDLEASYLRDEDRLHPDQDEINEFIGKYTSDDFPW